MDAITQQTITVMIDEGIIPEDYTESDLQLDLLKNNAIDSLGIVRLISALEENFDIEFRPDQILGVYWVNVEAIVALVRSLVEEQQSNRSGL